MDKPVVHVDETIIKILLTWQFPRRTLGTFAIQPAATLAVVMYSRRTRASNISAETEIASIWRLPGPTPIDPASHSFDLKRFIHKRTVGVNESYSGVVNIVTRWRGRGRGVC